MLSAGFEFLLEPEYLRHGSRQQKEALGAIRSLGIFEILRPFHPVLAGTFPLDLQVHGSDLDVLTQSSDLNAFQEIVQSQFQSQRGFRIGMPAIGGTESFVAGFSYGGFEFEIFCQNRPVLEQDGFQHLLAEYRLLSLAREPFRAAVMELKRSGTKTEPAFASALRHSGDAYAFLRRLAAEPDETLIGLLQPLGF